MGESKHWISEWERDILELRNNEDYGCIFECNLEYLKELNCLHKDLPLAPEN